MAVLRCDQCGEVVERVWGHQPPERTAWLCRYCHLHMELAEDEHATDLDVTN